jgi:branched-chain amino acid transport system substrate-binding protein
LKRRTALGALASTAFAPFVPRRTEAAGDIVFGVSGPFSGDDADYGRVWKLGMNLAIEEIGRAGGVGGHRLSLDYEDTQSDPKQSVVVAERFAGDPRILAELGDFSSAASIAAAPIYQRAHLVQFGFTNSAPAFTEAGTFMWSTSRTTRQDSALIARTTHVHYGRKHAVVYQASAWGTSAAGAYGDAAKRLGADIVVFESYLADQKDFRALLSKVRDAGPDVLVLFAYDTDGALILAQAADVGLQAKIVTSGACYNQRFIDLGGDAVEGVVMPVEFFSGDTRPDIRRFVDRYTARYHEPPDLFAAYAYDSVNILAFAAKHGGFTRDGVRSALSKARSIPSVVNGAFHFGPDRRVVNGRAILITVKNHTFVPVV